MQVVIRDSDGKQLALADVVEGTDGTLAVHKSVGGINGKAKWSLAHAPTGARIASYPTKKRAVSIGLWIWSQVTDHKLFASKEMYMNGGNEGPVAARALLAATRDEVRKGEFT